MPQYNPDDFKFQQELMKLRESSDYLYQNDEQLMQLLGQRKDPINHTFSVKYLGITEGRIGILSRRLPIPTIERSKTRINNSP